MQMIRQRLRSTVMVGLFVATLGITNIYGFVATAHAYSGSGNGSGTPYQVSSCAQLAEINLEPGANYALTQDLDCTSSGNTVIINQAFNGSFDGGNHTLTIALTTNTDSQPLALFSGINGGTFTNLTFAGTVTNTATSAESTAALTYGLFGGSATNLHSTVAVTSTGVAGGLFGFVSGGSSVDDSSVTADITGTNVGGVSASTGCESVLTNVSYSGTITASSSAGGISSNDSCEGPGSTFDHVTSSGTITSTGDQVGGLVGSGNSIITDSSSSMDVSGNSQVGGLMGDASYTTISGSYATGDVTATAGNVGGLVGSVVGSDISNSYATGAVHANGNEVGGFIGYLSGSTVNQSYATGTVENVEGSYDTGGFVGVNAGSATINDSYARGNVAGDVNVGGFVGYNFEATIHRSYAAGAVTGLNNAGGFVAFNDDGSIVSSFWDIDTSNQGSSSGATGKTTAEMHDEATYTDTTTSGLTELWDFVGNPHEDEGTDDVWTIGEPNDGYPCLTWDQNCVPVASVDLETKPATDVTDSSVTLNGEAHLHNGATSADNGQALLIGFHLNTSSTVDWQNNIYSAPTETVSDVGGDNTHVIFSVAIPELQCGTQYWYVAAYTYGPEVGDSEIGMANNVETFTTAACSAQDDGDGVPAEMEQAAPNNGDGNNDGAQDSEQGNVSSFIDTKTNKYVTVALNEQCALSNVSSAAEDGNWKKDDVYTYTSGFVNFTADCGDDGFVATVSVYYYDTNKDGLTVRKYNPTPQTYTSVADVTDVSLDQQTIGGQSVAVASYQITDGGDLDTNGQVDGVIVDPVALGSEQSAASSGGLAESGQNVTLYLILATVLVGTTLGTVTLVSIRRKKQLIATI